MDNQNPAPTPSTQFSPLTQNIVPTPSPQAPVEVFPQTPIQSSPLNSQITPKPNNKKKIITIAIIIFIILLILVAGYFAYQAYANKKYAEQETDRSVNQLSDNELISTPALDNSYVPYTPEPEKVCNSPLAPVGTTDFERCYYRNVRASIAEAQAVQNHVGETIGTIVVSDKLQFHEEVYKGIRIKWTDKQPISADTMSWLKSGLDLLPSYFYQDHPVTAIISADSAELGMTSFTPEDTGAFAYASGLNIFLTKVFAEGKSNIYSVDKPTAIYALFHEWVHVVQHYEMLVTFTEEYLSIPDNVLVAFPVSPVNKSYAKAAGWVFQNDEFGNSTYAKLGTDSDSQKQSEYGKTKYIEDMAEAGTNFMLCRHDVISEARIAWWETITGTNRSTYCPSKI